MSLTGYSGVYKRGYINGKPPLKPFNAQLNRQGIRWRSPYFLTAREAAIALDKKLIELGEPPVNILKAKP